MVPHCTGKGEGLDAVGESAWYSAKQMCGLIMLLSILRTSESAIAIIYWAIIADKEHAQLYGALSPCGGRRRSFHIRFLCTQFSCQRLDGHIYNDSLYMRRDCNPWYMFSMDMNRDCNIARDERDIDSFRTFVRDLDVLDGCEARCNASIFLLALDREIYVYMRAQNKGEEVESKNNG